MKYQELNKLPAEELNKKVTELHKDLIKLNNQVATGTTLKSPGQIKKSKRTIARIKTILTRRKRDKPHE